MNKDKKITDNITISAEQDGLRTLSFGKIGVEYIVASLEDCNKILEAKLNSMGIYVGCIINILQNNRKMPLKIAIGNGRIGIDQLIANKISIRRI